MLQLLQDLSSGETYLKEAPAAKIKRGNLVISSNCSLISAGTERMLLNFGKASYLEKAKQQPEKVKQVLDKVKTDGLKTTYDAVKSKLSEPIPLGYCNVGTVLEVGADCDDFAKGDRVISNGSHADLVRVPKNLCAKVPDNVDDESAAFTVLASIALQGIRLAQPTLGESVVVTGVGLIGLLAVQLLRAQGCRVLAIDFDQAKLALAAQFGADTCNPGNGDDVLQSAQQFSRGRGVDAVLITASTKSSEPVSQAANMCRKRGRIILVGVTGLELNRAEFYEKELTFQVSCSYGPGRYDPTYEEQGRDYPIGFVRWTEQRNFEAILDLMSSGALQLKPLISHSFKFTDAADAYQVLTDEPSALGILLKYADLPVEERVKATIQIDPKRQFDPAKPVLAVIGAGNYASRVLIPAFKEAEAQLHTIATTGGASAVVHGEKNQFANATSDTESVFQSAEVNTVVVATRHDNHASLVCAALNAGKHVFVEKPLAINRAQLEAVEQAYRKHISEGGKGLVMVGFNRRFAPHVVKMKALLDGQKVAKSFVMTVNAGFIPAQHWTQDPQVGGGRIIGEACHFIDLLRFLCGHEISSVSASCAQSSAGQKIDDVSNIQLTFADGSIGSIHYFANGDSSFPKERLEVFSGGKVLQLDNYRKLKGYGYKGLSSNASWSQDKGHKAGVAAFLKSIEQGQASPIDFNELLEVARATLTAAEQLTSES